MTELTRIACPGCRERLRIEPEALDFPGTCKGCECRFTVGVYVQVSCPKCQRGSKIRESYWGQRVRCIRCKHDFIPNEGIMPGEARRLLVARKLDSGPKRTPPAIRPALDPTGEGEGPDLAPPAVDRFLEAERLKAEAIAERDRLAEEAGLFKAILARMVATQPERDVRAPEPSDATIDGLIEERGRFERLAQGLNTELELAWAEAAEARRAAREAEEREIDLKERLDRAVLEILEAEEESSRLVEDFANDLEAEAQGRSILVAKVTRLDRAARSAMAGEAEALGRLGEFVARSAEIGSATAAELDRERQRRKELARIVEGLEAEVKAARRAEQDCLGLSAEVQRLTSEVEAARSAEAMRSAGLESTAREFEERRRWLDEEIQRAGIETERRQADLFAEVQRLQQLHDKVAAENKALVRWAKHPVEAGPSFADPARPAVSIAAVEPPNISGFASPHVGMMAGRPIVASASDASLANALATREMEDCRDLAVIMLYDDEHDGGDGPIRSGN